MHTDEQGRRRDEISCGKDDEIYWVVSSLGLPRDDVYEEPRHVHPLFQSLELERKAEEPASVFIAQVLRAPFLEIEPTRERRPKYRQFKQEWQQALEGVMSDVLDRRLRVTEDLIRDRVQLTETQILDAIKRSPYAFIDLFSKIGLVGFALFFTLYIVSDLYLVNPAFALFGIVACGLYLLISRFGRSREQRGDKPNVA